MNILDQLAFRMFEYETGTPKRIQHLLKVHRFAQLIGLGEGLDEETQFTLETAALVHDIGIKPALEKFNTDAGPYQEKEGVAPAQEMLSALGFDQKVIDRVCYLVAHHHTYVNVEGLDYRILLEADFLVNLYEGNQSMEAVLSAKKNIFRTATGLKILNQSYQLED